jgi:hypothetical protein
LNQNPIFEMGSNIYFFCFHSHPGLIPGHGLFPQKIILSPYAD